MKLTLRIPQMAAGAAVLLAIAWMAQPCQAHEENQRRFATPEEAITALQAAAKTGDKAAMDQIFGRHIRQLMTGDEVQDKTNFESFSRAVDEACKPQADGADRLILNIGADKWPFPIPLVKQHGQWYFDTDEGKEEIINRHIGRGELNAIAVCRDYAVAQNKYHSKDRDGSGVMKYAQKFKSTPGMKDGLFWEKGPNEEGGPLGWLVEEAHEEGYGTNKTAGPHSFHGYYFRILTAQGSSAAGGKMSYLDGNGNMTGGFALVAYPEKWGKSGIMTFIVGSDGKVYRRNLGKETEHLGSKMKEYNPDSKWILEEDQGIAEK
jgi:hypothetical protein